MIYLASPYTHESPAVMNARAEAARFAALQLMQQGLVVFSPIVYGRQFPEIEGDWSGWQRHCLGWLDAAASLMVLELPGWKNSIGVRAEIKHAQSRRLPILRMDAPDVPGL